MLFLEWNAVRAQPGGKRVFGHVVFDQSQHRERCVSFAGVEFETIINQERGCGHESRSLVAVDERTMSHNAECIGGGEIKRVRIAVCDFNADMTASYSNES
ncbi:MAG TPA: hypothetical protein VN802_10220 [Stellaceae bacterium]|nr:hypothetical protein [Stellaceae bacterium]